MKHCVCISCFDHYSTRMQMICKYFMNSGYQTKYLYANFDHFNKSQNNNNHKNGVKVRVPEYKKNLSLQRIYSHHVFSKKTIKYIKNYEPDLIYCMVPPNSLVMELAKYKSKNMNVKLVFDCYDMWPENFPYHRLNLLLNIPFSIWSNLRKKYISFGDLIVCVSEQGKEILKNEVKSKPVKVIKPVIDVGELPVYKSDITELSFCYLGMVNHIIDIDLGVLILGAIAKERKTILHIIGEGQNLDEFVSKLKVVDVNVVCHGIVFDMGKKNEIFSKCNLGLCIPREEINSTMPLKAVEYMRAGLPFLNNALGDIRDTVTKDDIGRNIDKANLSTVVDFVLKLKSDDMIQMHKNCVESYNKRFLNQDYDSIFESIRVES